MATSDEQPAESEMLPDEREAIAERAGDLDELDDDEFLTTDELAEKLGFSRE
ncbi:hypothetical protein [Halosimplex pelagicum]|uniref:Uncharacterized protein n=1 Tax=Halosimplex pelagicum TaxID=869886 RepID=A0A7D5P9C0_9EURY|nr:hypothetical protein [Halosimplex pelagicum]QLH80985.1 hypothetical protein HZS54_04745 [Halosimplex pelagicum]